MERAHVDITRDLEDEPVVHAVFDLREEEIGASAHAVAASVAERFRNEELSADDVVEFRELAALADELSELVGGAGTIVMRPARLNAYRNAILTMHEGSEKNAFAESEKFFVARPGDSGRAAVADWLRRHAENLADVRRAADKPALGFVYGGNGSMVDAELWPNLHGGGSFETTPFWQLLLPHIFELRSVALAVSAEEPDMAGVQDTGNVISPLEKKAALDI